jgi:type IV pilus assembly protein PilA
MLARIRKSTDGKDQGFTLIELLVVMIIIGILAAIAIPVFLNQRQKAVDTSIKSDIKSAADVEETNFVDTQAYLGTAALLAKIKLSSSSTTLEVMTSASGYCLRAQNTSGSTGTGTWYWYDSQGGGLQNSATASALVTTGACGSSFTKTA